MSRASEYQREADYHASHHSIYTEAKIGQACINLAPVKQAQCAAEARNDNRANQRDEQDLVAQRQSALWTSIMGAVAVVGFGLSAIGVWLVYTTFRETRLSNEISQKSVLQSYIHPGFANIKVDSTGSFKDVSVRFHNVGQSPAIEVYYFWKVFIEVSDTVQFYREINSPLIKNPLSAIAPNDERTVSLPIDHIQRKAIRAPLAEKQWVCLRGAVYWRAMSGKLYRTTFVYKVKNLKPSGGLINLQPVHCNAPAYQEVDDQGQPIKPAKS